MADRVNMVLEVYFSPKVSCIWAFHKNMHDGLYLPTYDSKGLNIEANTDEVSTCGKPFMVAQPNKEF